MRMTTHILTSAAVVAAFAATTVVAQAQNVRVRGTIEKLDGNTVMVKSRDGASLKLVLKDNAADAAGSSRPRSPTSRPPPTSLSPRGRAPTERSRRSSCASFPPGAVQLLPRRLGPHAGLSFMTNGAAQTSVAAVDGQVLTVEYKIPPDKTDMKKILVTPKTIIATTVPAPRPTSSRPEGIRRRCAEAARRLARCRGDPGGKGNSPAAVSARLVAKDRAASSRPISLANLWFWLSATTCWRRRYF